MNISGTEITREFEAQGSPLLKHVAGWLTERGEDYESGPEGVYEDLMYGGCQSGMVGHLIYHVDTCAFFEEYADEISTLLSDMCEQTGQGPNELFGDKWDETDPLARDTMNQNLLAWFGFEESAHLLMESY